VIPDHDPECLSGSDAIDLVIEGRPHGVGSLTVARLLPSPRRRMIGPFTFVDHMGPVVIAPGIGFDVRPHPHIGLSTVTYFFEGENVHRDNLGTVQTIRPGDVNLMTAGRGVVHSERADPAWRERGGLVHGVQIWLALPVENEDDPPSFEHHPAAALPQVAPAAGVRGRVIAGEAFGARSPLRHPGRPLLVDLLLDAGACLELRPDGPDGPDGHDGHDGPDGPDGHDRADAEERGVLVVSGAIELSGQALAADRLAALRPGAAAGLRATEPSRVMLLGGPPLGARFMDWNFVASTRERIDRARDAWKAQAFPRIPGDDQEFIPYPELHR
jgi:redox-sensitive bicupin YhaK (pirin superfamily)